MKKYIDIQLDNLSLTKEERKEITFLLNNQNKQCKNEVEQIWYLMDLIWEKYKCNQIELNWDNITKFYNHPVWILNGLLIEQHEVSMKQRNAIAVWLTKHNLTNVLDYGGGFGTLAKQISKHNPNIKIDIFEPHPSQYALNILNKYENIYFCSSFSKKYDVIISTDVLEHVPDPLQTFFTMVQHLKKNGYLIVANCFEPVMQCHLPQTFHLKYTFNFFAELFNLKNLGPLINSHATIYQKISNEEPDWNEVKLHEKMSKKIYKEIANKIPKPINKTFEFNQQLVSLYKKMDYLMESKMKYILYGAGTGAKTILSYMQNHIEYIVDKNDSLESFEGINIFNLKKLEEEKELNIIISVFGREEEIKDTLVNDYNIPLDKIIILV